MGWEGMGYEWMDDGCREKGDTAWILAIPVAPALHTMPVHGAEMELGRKVGQSELLADRRRWTCVSGDEKLFVRSRMKWAETGRGAE